VRPGDADREEDSVSPSELTVRLADIVRELRQGRRWSLEDLADESGLHRTHLGLVERGERRLSITSAEQVARAFGVSLSAFVALGESSWRPRIADPALCLHEDEIRRRVGLECDWVSGAIEATYATLDSIDERLTQVGSPVLAKLVELANLSAMIGNILGAGLASASRGLYVRNRPHAYPDLIPTDKALPPIELKMALETNTPKGHLPKAGLHVTFRYVLGDRDGNYSIGKDHRGDTAWIWEARLGELAEGDFSFSNTEGDSGKTAVIKSTSFDEMPVVYYDEMKCPYKRGRKPRAFG
jgi:transcriptional regulator with XRE-family HTH domain